MKNRELYAPAKVCFNGKSYNSISRDSNIVPYW